MTFYSDRLKTSANEILSGTLNIRSSTSVPETGEILLEKNQGVLIDACYVYADMADSSGLAHKLRKEAAAKIIRSYVNAASNILKHYDGEIRSFDGDRVMAVFVGSNKETMAVRAALAINWFVVDHLRDRIGAQWSDVPGVWNLGHGVGVDTGEALLTRAGVRGDNDIVSIGGAPNTAAKLSSLRDGYSIHITKAVYEPMSNAVAFYEDGRSFWTPGMTQNVGGTFYTVYRTNTHWEP